jgi:CRP-like cAMP-binding protein
MPKAVDLIIQEAMERGEFDNLPGKGKPIDLTAYFDTPEEVRIAYALLKSADILPEETEILKEIARLKTELDSCTVESKRKIIQKAIEHSRMKFNMMMERRKSR